jgi:hypothetical protein
MFRLGYNVFGLSREIFLYYFAIRVFSLNMPLLCCLGEFFPEFKKTFVLLIAKNWFQRFKTNSTFVVSIWHTIRRATTRYFYALKIYGAILPQNKQILCHYSISLSNSIGKFFQEKP